MKKRVLLGLSGGVDSAVAALLLKKQGYEVIGAFMKNFSDTKNSLTGDCNYIEDKKEAQKIAALLNIKFIMLDFEKEYKKLVINPMFRDYKKGLTPNPDSLCNKVIKFPLMWKEAKKLNADCIATGHFIRKKKTKSGFKLLRAKDEDKDQSYFLYDLTQKDLEHTLFPIGNYTKQKVRKIAKKNKFPNHNKKSTSGVCFIGNIQMKPFLKQKIKEKLGKVITIDGETIGTHQGASYYTIGERVGPRSGFNIKKSPENSRTKYYIANKKKNEIIVAPEGHKSLYKDKFKIINLNWINKPKTNVKVRIRHLGELISGEIKNNTCKLKKPIFGLASGQSVVIYKGKEVLGGGEIRL